MSVNRVYILTLVTLILIFGYLLYKIIYPFLNPIAWAIVFAIVFYPMYSTINKILKSKSIASIITILIIIIIILGPFSYIVFLLFREINDFISTLDTNSIKSIDDVLSNSRLFEFINKIQAKLGIERMDISSLIIDNLKKIGEEIFLRLSSSLKNIANLVLDFIFMFISLFFFFKDGTDIMNKIKDYLPFTKDDKDRIMFKIKDMIISTVYGGIIVAVVQGLIGGISFYFLGIKSPVLLGSSIFIMSFLPLLGTFSIWGPMVAYLIFKGYLLKGIILMIIGVFGISMVDNILKPIIISGRTKMPTLVIFFSVLGGIKLFGFIGFIIGPLIVILFISLFDIFRHLEGGIRND